MSCFCFKKKEKKKFNVLRCHETTVDLHTYYCTPFRIYTPSTVTMFFFDLLPVELVHTIFRYLWAHEILHGFSNQSDYIDSVLQTYDRYAICLCSMLKNQFDQMYRRIQPKQVFSLAFMNEDETPDQSTLFFSRFDIQQFVNLRSFAIVSADHSLLRTLNFLSQLKKFKSIVIPYTSDFYWCFNGSHVENILPDLKRLDINGSHLTKPLKNLQHLRIPHCYCYRVEYLLHFVPNLRSLDITISLDTFPFWLKKIPPMNHLRQFILHIHCKIIKKKAFVFFILFF